AVAAIAVRVEERREIGQEEHGGGGHASQRLVEAEESRFTAEVSTLYELEGGDVRVIGVGARLDAFYGMHAEVEIHRFRGDVDGPGTRGVPKRCREVVGADGLAGELTR